jgi:hypothetical protein
MLTSAAKYIPRQHAEKLEKDVEFEKFVPFMLLHPSLFFAESAV